VTTSVAGQRAIPRTVWALGFVSMFMDISSEMIHALLPVFLVSTLGASAMMVGIIEGLGEGTMSITKIFSGAISDWLGKRKLLAVIGYGLGALSKPFFAASSTVSAKAYGERRATRSSPISLRLRFAAQRSASDSRSIPSAPFRARSSPWRSSPSSRAIFASCSG
jgi:hypothetical protein